ncbi:MAG TPA: hypothetical protein VEL75_04285, partial [Candidatus Methylomirabilis sp.]|nr:hypothetical protein [Candidatus Methylomirabilis sp.]
RPPPLAVHVAGVALFRGQAVGHRGRSGSAAGAAAALGSVWSADGRLIGTAARERSRRGRRVFEPRVPRYHAR